MLHIPSFVYSLISVTTLAKRGSVVQFNETCVKILRDGQSVASASLQTWHAKMSYVHQAGVLNMARRKVVVGMEIPSNKQDNHVCEACIDGKMHHSSIPRVSTTRAEGVLDLVHTHVVSPLPVSSKGGALYFVTFIDGKSRWLIVFPITAKSDCISYFLKFQSSAENRTGRNIKAIRSDGGGEYQSNEFKTFLSQNGIWHQQTCAYTPQQNGVAEQMNRTLKDLLRAMLAHRNVTDAFWAEALCTAAYIRNRLTSRALPRNKTPFHIWFGNVPDVAHLRVFGCRAGVK